jgi:uncharacterized protein YrrD
MLHRGTRLQGARVRGTDGDIGTVERIYFDDERWTIAGLRVQTKRAVDGRPVLLSPASIEPHWNVATVPATLSRSDAAHAPIDEGDGHEDFAKGAAHVRSVEDLKGLHIEATDGEIGHVDDVLIDEDSWRIAFLLVDTSNWIGGKWVAVSPGVLRGVDWVHGKVKVAITRDDLKASPDMESMGVPSVEAMPPFVLI